MIVLCSLTVFGYIGSMPIAGPIAALIFARALQGRGRRLHIALGAATAEMICAGLAFWGFAALLGYARRDPV